MKFIKKILWLILIIIAILIAITFFYKDTIIKDFVKNYNKNLNVTIAYNDVNLSLFKRFPHATFTINNLSIVNKEPLNDTILKAESVFLAMNIEELFKKTNEKITINEILIKDAKLNLRVTENGASNFDIHNINTLSENSSNIKKEQESFNFDIKKYRLENTDLQYKNKQTSLFVDLKGINHTGSVGFSADNTQFITKTSAQKIEVTMNGLQYEIPKQIAIDAKLNLDFKQNRITVQNLVINNAHLKITPIENKNSKLIAQVTSNTQEKTQKTINKPKVSKQIPNFTFDLKKYQFNNARFIYKSIADQILVDLKGLNHGGNAILKGDNLDLTTKSLAEKFTLKISDVNYINQSKIDLDAVLGINLNTLKITLKENKGKLNDLDLVFNGFVDINDYNQEIDIKFNSPKADFKQVLSLIPSAYSKSFNGVSANGIANVNGVVKGFNSVTEIPKYNIHIKTENASFKYPNLPKEVQNISFDGAVISTSSKNDVFLDIKDLKFTIDQDTFETNGKITNLTNNPTFDVYCKGTLDLENLTQAYPIKLDHPLTGILKADFTTKADMNSIDTNNFKKIKTNGTASLTDFKYHGKDVAKPIYVNKANVKFNTNSVLLTHFNAKTGDSDINATGNLENIFAFLFNDKKLKGNFKVNSNLFKVSDFLVDENKAKENTPNLAKNGTQTESLKIPKFLDVNTHLTAKKVVYDNLILTNVSGNMALKNQKAIITNSVAKMLDGNITFNGNIDTQQSPSVFDLDLLIDKFDIANSFQTLETFQKIVPIAKAMKGKYNSNFKLKGFLNDDFSPNVNSANGNAFAELVVTNLDNTAIPLLNVLTSNLNFIDFSQIDLSKLNTVFTFANGNVNVEPFDIKYKDVVMHISGSHGFDQSLKYNLQMDVPAKYLGTEAVNLLSKLTNINKDTIQIPLSTFIGGTIGKPQVRVDFKSAVKNLAVKVIKYQKEEVKNQVTNTVDSIVGGVIDDIIKDPRIDSIIPFGLDSVLPNPSDIIKDGIDNIFGNKKKK